MSSRGSPTRVTNASSVADDPRAASRAVRRSSSAVRSPIPRGVFSAAGRAWSTTNTALHSPSAIAARAAAENPPRSRRTHQRDLPIAATVPEDREKA